MFFCIILWVIICYYHYLFYCVMCPLKMESFLFLFFEGVVLMFLSVLQQFFVLLKNKIVYNCTFLSPVLESATDLRSLNFSWKIVSLKSRYGPQVCLLPSGVATPRASRWHLRNTTHASPGPHPHRHPFISVIRLYMCKKIRTHTTFDFSLTPQKPSGFHSRICNFILSEKTCSHHIYSNTSVHECVCLQTIGFPNRSIWQKFTSVCKLIG